MTHSLHIGLQIVMAVGLWGATDATPDVQQLLEGYGKCSARLDTVSYELQTTQEYGGNRRVYSLQYCSDHERKRWIGNWTCYNEDGTVDDSNSGLIWDIYGEGFGIHLWLYDPEAGGTLQARADLARASRQEYLRSYLEHESYGGVLTGRFSGSNDQSVHDLLAAASNPRKGAASARILGYDAYLVEADTLYGTVKVWIAPEVGYNCLKWEIRKTPQQYYRDGAVGNDDFIESIAAYDADRVEDIDGQHLVTEARFRYTVNKGDEVLNTSAYRFVLSDVDLNPDYDTLRAFEIDLPEGTVVRDVDQPDAWYTWTGDQLVAAEAPGPRRLVVAEAERPKVAEPADISPVSVSNIARHVERLAAIESRHVAHPGNKEAQEYIVNELTQYGYSPLMDAFEAEDTLLHNILSGSSDRSKPAILISAHFDSSARIDGVLSPRAPGADDNASGVAVVLELARLLQDRAADRNIEFVFFNAEETDKTGSSHLSDAYKVNQWPIDYLINLDTVGTWAGPLSQECPVNYVTDNRSVGVIEHLKERFPYWLRKSTISWPDDHTNFWRNNFRAIEITEDNSTPHMHTPADTPEKLQYDNIAKIAYGLYLLLER